MRLDQATRRLNNAIHDCLNACYSSSNPLDAIARFIEQLRCNPEWDSAEIDRVEQAARRMLRSIVVRRESDRLSPVSRWAAPTG